MKNAVSAPRKTMKLIKIGENPCKTLRKARFGARGKDASGGVMEWRKTLENIVLLGIPSFWDDFR